MFSLLPPRFSLCARLALMGLLLVFLAGGCAGLGGVGEQQPTLTPIPTSSLPGIPSVPTRACLVGEQVVIQVDKSQGDLVAWSPTQPVLAYVAPSSESAWLLGNLEVVTAPGFADPQERAVKVFGNLTWSPQGSLLAFVSLRTGDGLYTVEVTSPDGKTPTQDLFPGEAARSDDWVSQKAIRAWRGPDRLAVLTSCGLDCMQPVELNLATGAQTLASQTLPRPWDLWVIHTIPQEELPGQVLEGVLQPNASPAGQGYAYIDPQGGAWVVEGGVQFPLEIGPFRNAHETDWSSDGEYLAVRADDRLLIFSFACP